MTSPLTLRRLVVVAPLLALSAACASTGRSPEDAVREESAGALDSATFRAAPESAAVQVVPTRAPDVIFVPTPVAVVEQMLTLADVGSGDVVFDLGSGDGRIVIGAAKRGAKAVGIDIDPKRIAESRANADTAKVTDRVEFRHGDLFQTDLRSANAVTLYLLPTLNVKLRPKLFEELRPGTPVVSNSFDMGDWKPDSTVQVEGRSVHLWIIPAKVDGPWKVTVGEGESAATSTLSLEQAYQQLTGSMTTGERTSPVTDGQVRGTRVHFTVRDSTAAGSVPVTFDGEVKGNTITGTVTRTGAGGTSSFRATR
jgi:hypothetical protein